MHHTAEQYFANSGSSSRVLLRVRTADAVAVGDRFLIIAGSYSGACEEYIFREVMRCPTLWLHIPQDRVIISHWHIAYIVYIKDIVSNFDVIDIRVSCVPG